jgi:deoxyribonuclease IV
MMRIGAHMSVAGGVSKAVDRAALHGCEALQIFAKNANQWRGKPIDHDEIRRFRRRLDETGIAPTVSHASYLINLASTADTLRAQSRAAMADEIDRAEALGLLGVVLHPGCYTSGSPAQGIRLIASSLRDLLDERPMGQTMVLLEHTAGQGSAIGSRFEELAEIIAGMEGHPRVGVCLDTCHLLASGYDIASDEGYRRTFTEFGKVVGLERLKAFHLNDSKKPLGSRVDRHEHIGEGCLGLAPFQRILNDQRFAGLPMLIETEKSPAASHPTRLVADPLDMRNLDALRRLRSSAAVLARRRRD